MSKVKFELKARKTKPSRRYRKGSKYDPIIDEFLKGDANLVEVSVEGKQANYLRTLLNKRIEARDLKDELKISVINNVAYLEKR